MLALLCRSVDFRADLLWSLSGLALEMQWEISEEHENAQLRCFTSAPCSCCSANRDPTPCCCTKGAGGGLVVRVLGLLYTLVRKDCNRGGHSGKIKGWRPTQSQGPPWCAPCRLLWHRAWGGLCVGKSQACAPGRRDRVWDDMKGEIFGAAPWSSCSEALATVSSHQAETLCVHREGVKRRAPGSRSQTSGFPQRF